MENKKRILSNNKHFIWNFYLIISDDNQSFEIKNGTNCTLFLIVIEKAIIVIFNGITLNVKSHRTFKKPYLISSNVLKKFYKGWSLVK